MVIGHCHRTRKLQSRDQTQVCLTPEATFSGRVLCVPGPRGSAASGISKDSSGRLGCSSHRSGLYLESHQGDWEGTLRSPAPMTRRAVTRRGLCQSTLGLPHPDRSGHVRRQRLVKRPAGVSPAARRCRQREPQVVGPEGPLAHGCAGLLFICWMGNGP